MTKKIKRMTKNEYKQYMKDCAGRLYSVPGYTMEMYNRDLDEVKILPLDLKRFHFNPTLKKWINKLFDEEDVDRNGNYMLRGFTRHEGTELVMLGLSYGDYANSYSFYAYNDKSRMIYTYCEGDTTLTLFENEENYLKAKQETATWYKKEYV